MRKATTILKLTLTLLALAAWLALALIVVTNAGAASPEPQGFDNICRCYSPVCWFRAAYQPNGERSDGAEEPLLLWMTVPRWAVAEFVSGNWGCSRGM